MLWLSRRKPPLVSPTPVSMVRITDLRVSAAADAAAHAVAITSAATANGVSSADVHDAILSKYGRRQSVNGAINDDRREMMPQRKLVGGRKESAPRKGKWNESERGRD